MMNGDGLSRLSFDVAVHGCLGLTIFLAYPPPNQKIYVILLITTFLTLSLLLFSPNICVVCLIDDKNTTSLCNPI